MKNNFLVYAGLAILLLGGFWLYNSKQDDSSSVMEAIPTAAETMGEELGLAAEGERMDATEAEGANTENSGSYKPFSPEVLASTADTRRVLFFYANWCPTCRPVDKALMEQASQIPAGVTVIRVNYNDTETDQAEKDLAAKYGVTYQHTFVEIDAQGQALAKWNGGSLSELVSKLK